MLAASVEDDFMVEALARPDMQRNTETLIKRIIKRNQVAEGEMNDKRVMVTAFNAIVEATKSELDRRGFAVPEPQRLLN
jgi:hypothetical protein